MGGEESEKNIDELISTNICELIFYFFFICYISPYLCRIL